MAELLSSTEHGLAEAKELYLKALGTEREAIGDITADPLASKVLCPTFSRARLRHRCMRGSAPYVKLSGSTTKRSHTLSTL